jgi:DNA-binding NtrC family response regulator
VLTKESGAAVRVLRILYVDDELPLLELTKRILTRWQCDVETYVDPREALCALQLKPESYDVLLTDLNMPGLSGFALIVEARKCRPTLPALIVTGYLSPEDADRVARLGNTQIVQKASTVESYLQELQTLLSTHR